MTHSHDRTLLASLGFADPDRNEPLHDLACRYLSEPAQLQRLIDLIMPKVWRPRKRTVSRKWQWSRYASLRAEMRENGLFFGEYSREEVFFRLDDVDKPGGYKIERRWGGNEWCMGGLYGTRLGTSHESHKIAFADRFDAISALMNEIESSQKALHAHGKEIEASARSVSASWKAGKPELEGAIQKGEGKYRTTIGFADLIFLADELERCQITGVAPDGSSLSAELDLPGFQTMFLIEVKSRQVPAASILRQLRLYEEYLRPQWGEGIHHKVQLVAATTFQLPPGESAMLREQGVTPIYLGDPFRRWVEEQKTRVDDGKPVEEF